MRPPRSYIEYLIRARASARKAMLHAAQAERTFNRKYKVSADDSTIYAVYETTAAYDAWTMALEAYKDFRSRGKL